MRNRTSDSASSESTRLKNNKRKRLDAVTNEDDNDNDSSQLRRSGRARRAPIILDASPTPSRKRFKSNEAKTGVSGALFDKEEGRGWKARLRSTATVTETSNGKRKLFENDSFVETTCFDDSDSQAEEKEVNGVVEGFRNGVELTGVGEDGNELKKVELACGLPMTVDEESLNLEDSVYHVAENEDVIVLNVDNHCTTNDGIDTDQPNSAQLESFDVVKIPENCFEENEVCGVSVDKQGIGKIITEDEAPFDKTDEKANDEHVPVTANSKITVQRKSNVKEGRRCGLCGVGTDGRPPKPLVRDSPDSENEACSDFSASEETNYDIWDGFGDEPGWLGRLLGPINDRYGIAGTWVHQNCAVWSPEVYFAGLGCLKNVRTALFRGRALKCVRCGRRGATIGCRVDRCPKAYHLPCARATGCIFDHRKFLVACAEHRYIFQAQGSIYMRQIKKMKAKKMKLELRKKSSEASRKDCEAEEKWMEKCGEDEEFVKREKKRLQRDLQRLAPVYIGGGATSEKESFFQGWESVAGLEDVVRCMKEVVILPLLYPEYFTKIGLTPPRGVLLHGYPGTGKTLVVRALIGSCARGDKRIAYFARKGADCLGKYVGDAERQLRLLFQVAERSQPSIIFFDEIDGLAPCRTRKQDQTQSSVVSTLLALMDGLNSRGSVIVIGATNRPDSVDPALRRPGRFDREIYFPLPSTKDRSAILALQTQNWPKPVAGPLLKLISTKTAGFAGADLQALCTQAAMIALKRHCPLQKLLSAAGEGSVSAARVPLPSFVVQERDWHEALSCAPPPCSRREAGMAANDIIYSPIPTHLVPCMLQPLCNLLVSLYLDGHLRLPAPLSRTAKMIESTIIQTLDRKNLPRKCWWLEVDRLLEDDDVFRELVKKLSSVSEVCASANVQTDNSADMGCSGYLKHKINCPFTVAHGSHHVMGGKAGFRIMISGSPRSGHQHLASCFLNCFIGNIEIHKLDLATMAQEGHGDLLQGLTQILKKCSTANSCILFMPRVELWASEKCDPVHEKTAITEQPSEKLTPGTKGFSYLSVQENKQDSPAIDAVCATHLWNSFVEQVNTICVSSQLMILSTSEVPYAYLSPRTKQFFNSGELKSQNLMPYVNILPRFVVQIDGNINHNVVISSAAAKLSRDVIQLFIEIIYKRIHSVHARCEEYEPCSSLESNTVTITGGNDDHPGNSLASERSKNYPNPIIKTMKGRSNILLAISTFGYQILWYPQFAELNWVTSKLKDGPCADINGPWKTWPFNSCIVRPSNSIGNYVVARSPNSTSKQRDNYSLVRGLTAVGLLAYRGLYTSIQEVWLDVRKVLELLVIVISKKIDSGKDKYLFIHLLSQVAFLEDIVTNWVHTFKGLELIPQVPNETQEHAYTLPREDLSAKVDNISCEVKDEAVVTALNLDLSNHANQSCEDVFSCAPKSLVYPNNTGLSDSTVNYHHDGNAWNSDKDCTNEQIRNDHNLCDTEKVLKQTLPNGNFDSLGHSNGFLASVHDDLSKHSLEPRRKNDVELKSLCDQPDEDEYCRNEQILPAKQLNISGKEGKICLYNCCSKCMSKVHGFMQKLMARKQKECGEKWTVEDVDDIVRSLSANLILAFKSKYETGHSNKQFEVTASYSHNSNRPGRDTKQCKNFLLQECSHCIDTDSAASQIRSEQEIDLKFVFQDGILLPLDTDKDVCYHCKFSTLCLCALIEWVSVVTGEI